MSLTLNTFRRVPSLRVLLASAVLLALGATLLMAVNHSLHEALHDDAGEADHQCVATFLARDHILFADSLPILFVPIPGLELPPAGEVRPTPAAIEFLDSAPRAPPVRS